MTPTERTPARSAAYHCHSCRSRPARRISSRRMWSAARTRTEETGAAVLPRHLLERPDELLPDDLPLALGVVHAGELREEPVGRLHVDQLHVEVPREGVLDLFGFALAQEPRVDEHAGQ